MCVCAADPEVSDSRSYLGLTSQGRVESAAASLSWPTRSIWPVPLVIVSATANTNTTVSQGANTHTYILYIQTLLTQHTHQSDHTSVSCVYMQHVCKNSHLNTTVGGPGDVFNRSLTWRSGKKSRQHSIVIFCMVILYQDTDGKYRSFNRAWISAQDCGYCI